MFSSTKVDVLAEKLNIYEDLSKEMLSKLEAAVDKISEGNSNIARILAIHEQRLEQSDKSDAAILKLIESVQDQTRDLESRINELVKFRWLTVGIAIAAATIVSNASLFGKLLTPSAQSSIMHEQIKK